MWADQLGTPRQITDPANNQIVWRWDSEAFGNTQANQDPGNTGNQFVYNLRFPGQYYDAESGRHYNYFRDYDPSTGRYVQSDPIGLAGGSFSTYGYVNGNPLSDGDPLGLVTQCELSALREIINIYGEGPKVGPEGITTDPTATRGYGHTDFGGPITLHTNPAYADQYAGSATATHSLAMLVSTGLHENIHQKQSRWEHRKDAWREFFSGGDNSHAQDRAEAIMQRNPNIINDYMKRIEDCRKCSKFDQVVK
ncbi:putative deoxyribonuclease RhsC [Andreprevotia sp. IGB-42]|nr:putative deoxyribonuclease RhsC [Andreprevotia sp. IGB-42]